METDPAAEEARAAEAVVAGGGTLITKTVTVGEAPSYIKQLDADNSYIVKVTGSFKESLFPADILLSLIGHALTGTPVKRVTLDLSATENFPGITLQDFKGATSLVEISLPASKNNTVIGEEAFLGCTNLVKISIPDSVTEIGESAFYKCSALKDVHIPSAVTTIKKNTFYECTSLSEITIPKNIASIAEYAFYKSGIKKIIFDKESQLTEINCFSGCAALEQVEIPASVTKIGKNAFSLCTSLTTVSFEETAKVEELIGFAGCTSLTSIEIPPSVKTIADRAFSGCTALQSITVPKSVKTLGSSAFGNCTALSSVNFEAGSQLTALKGRIFSNCSSLRSIELPASVSSFEPNIFENCNKLTTIAVAAENTTYAAENNYVYTKGSKELFCAAPGITEVTVSGTVAEIASNAFDYCTELTKVTMADGCRSRGADFSKCTKLTDVAVVHTEGVTEGKFSFSGSTTIKNAVIAGDVPSVNYAFSNCTALEQVTIGDGVKEIYSAFYNCSKLPRIHIPASVTTFEGNFSGCIGLTELTVDPANAIYASENNCIYEKNLKELLAVATGLEEVVLPDSVKFMSEGNRTFQLHTVLKKLTIGTNLVSFPSDTFADCSALAEVRYKGSPSQWAAIEFKNEKANPAYFTKRIYFNDSDTIQKHITLSDTTSDKKVKPFTFINCIDIETIDMRDIRTIEARSFEGCTNLESIKLQDVGKGEIISSAFNKCEKLKKIYYYFDESDFNHKTWTEIKCWDKSPFKQPYELYFNDTLVKEAKLYSASFYRMTYQNCKSLEKCTVSISNGIADIPETMFADCSNLKSVTFGYTDKVEHIYSGAFLNCNALEEVRYERTIKDWCNIIFDGPDANPLKYGHRLYIGKKVSWNEWSYEPVTEPEVPILHTYKHYVFYGANFSKVTFAAGSEVIPDYTFAECKELTKVTIPTTMKTIGQSAFSNCTKLTTIEFEGTSVEWNGIKKEKEWNMGIPATAVKCLGDNVDVQL